MSSDLKLAAREFSLVALLALVMTLVVAGPAVSHSQTGNSVDTSTRPAEIRYTTASKYTDAVNNAINR